MAEKRKPDLTMLLRFQGNAKAIKIELFKAGKWNRQAGLTNRYRIRKDGKWFPDGEMRFFKISEVKELVFKGVHRNLKS